MPLFSTLQSAELTSTTSNNKGTHTKAGTKKQEETYVDALTGLSELKGRFFFLFGGETSNISVVIDLSVWSKRKISEDAG